MAFQACTSGGGGNEEAGGKESTAGSPEVRQSGPFHYSVYLENSGSLNGYLAVSGEGSFKDAVYNLITGINGFQEKASLNLYDINTVVIPVAKNANADQVNEYISGLDAATFKSRSEAKGGNQAKSDLRSIFKQVLDSTSGRQVSVLISDCIFSPDKGNALDYLSQQKAGIQGHFREKLNSAPFSTLVLQFTADFNGAYYYQNNTSKTGEFKARPYYIVCVGPEDALRGLFNYVEAKFHSRGYQNFLFLTSRKSYDVRPAVVINTVYYNYEPDKPMIVTGAQTGGRDNRFRIVLKANYSELPVSEAYLTDPANYKVSDGYGLASVTPVKDDKGRYTHELTLVADKPKDEKVKVALQNKLPGWIEASNLNGDQGLSPESLEGKTFGIRYLMTGLYDAYYTRDADPEYFNFSITVKD